VKQALRIPTLAINYRRLEIDEEMKSGLWSTIVLVDVALEQLEKPVILHPID